MQHFHQISWLQPWITSGFQKQWKFETSSHLAASIKGYILFISHQQIVPCHFHCHRPSHDSQGQALGEPHYQGLWSIPLAWGVTMIILESYGKLHNQIWGYHNIWHKKIIQLEGQHELSLLPTFPARDRFFESPSVHRLPISPARVLPIE